MTTRHDKHLAAVELEAVRWWTQLATYVIVLDASV